jgi:putative polyketide hydroxylase
MDTAVTETSPVLIVGGSLVGLSTAVFLAHRGVPTTLVERHAGSSLHPRAIGYTTRTIELFRAAGIQLPPSTQGGPPRRARVESLNGPWHEEYPWSSLEVQAPAYDYSPVRASATAQDHLEPILRARATELGADLRPGTELVSAVQDEEGVTATLRRRDDGHEYRLRADYLVAADGADSQLRRHLGIARSGHGLLSVQRSILFRAPLQDYLRHGVVQFEIEQPDLQAFLTTYSDGRWVLMLTDDLDRTDDEQRAVIRQAVGIDDLPIDLVTTGRWELSALIADQFSSGRIFLVGDAAHQLPPNRGGYGANTGIADAHNLSWKLAAVHAGISCPTLLDTYDAERRPTARLRHDQIFARADFKAYVDAPSSEADIIDDTAMELGQLYRSSILDGVDEEMPPARRPDEWNGQPGTRAPHLWVDESSDRSLLDEFGRDWVLVTDDPAWGTAATRATRDTGVPVRVVQVSPKPNPDAHREVLARYGLRAGGASLIRPDGYVAWRAVTAPASRTAALIKAIGTSAIPVPRSADRLDALEDRDAIMNLTIRYADAINRGWNGKTVQPEAIPQLFTVDGTFKNPGTPPTRGAESIAQGLTAATAPVPFAMHALLNPVLDIKDDVAKGNWLMWIAASGDDDARAAYLGADFTYTRTPGGWRIRSVTIEPGMRLPAN